MALVLAVVTSLGPLLGPVGCSRKPAPAATRVEPVDGLATSLFPARYGFGNPGGPSYYLSPGSFVLSPDGTKRLECQAGPGGFGLSFLLTDLSAGTAPVELFSSDVFEPGAQLTSYQYRVVWASDGRSLYVMAECPENAPQSAIVQRWTLDGKAEAVGPGIVQGWAIIAAVAGTPYLVALKVPPVTTELAIFDLEQGLVTALPGAVAWEDSAADGHFLYASGNLETPNPIFLGTTGSWQATEVASGRCARFRPGHAKFSYVAPNDEGTTTLWRLDTTGASPEALVELPFTGVADAVWSGPHSLYVLGIRPGEIEGSIVRVVLGQAP